MAAPDDYVGSWLDQSDPTQPNQNDNLPDPTGQTPQTDPLTINDARTPDQAAQDRAIGETLNQPTPAVQAYRDVFSRAANQARVNQATTEAPRLRAWLAQPDNFAVAHDDVHNLSFFENLTRGIHPANVTMMQNLPLLATVSAGIAGAEYGVGAYHPGQLFHQGEQDIEYGRLAYAAHQAQLGQGPPLTNQQINALNRLRHRAGVNDWGPPIFGPTERLLPQMLGSFQRGLSEAERRASAQWRADTGGDPLTSGPFGAGASTNRTGLNPVQRGLTRAIALGSSALAGIGGAGGGYGSFNFEQETGQAYDQMVQAGIDPTIAAHRAEQYGATATAIEFLGDSLGIKLSGIGRLALRPLLGASEAEIMGASGRRIFMETAGRIFATAIDEGPGEEGFQQIAQDLYQNQANRESGSPSPDITPQEMLANYLQAAWIGAQGGVGLGAVGAIPNYALDMRRLEASRAQQQIFQHLATGAQNSALRERLPSAMAQAVDAMTADTPIAAVRIDARPFAEELQQAGKDPYAVAQQVGVSAEQLDQALATGGDIEISTGQYAAHLAASEHNAALTQHMRLRPDDFTQAEMETAQREIQAQAKEALQQAQATSDENEIGRSVEARVRALFSEAQKEGGPRPEVAARYAQLAAALPRAMVARARAISPEYGAKVERQLRDFFGSNFDIAGPTRENATAGAQLNQRNGEPTRNARWSPPEGVKLSERERKIAEMAINGAGNQWIADEMSDGDKLVSTANISVTLNKVKRLLGGTAPWEQGEVGRAGINNAGERVASTEQLIALRDKLKASGYPTRGRTAMIAERFGLSPYAVSTRIHKFEAAQRQAAQKAEAVKTQRRAKVFDLDTPEARQEWFDEPGNVISEPIPGEALDSRSYGFALDNGYIVTVEVAPEPGGATTIGWTFLHRTLSGAEPFASGKEHLTIREKGALLARIQAVIEADMAAFKRDVYVWTPEAEDRMRAVRAMINRTEGTWPYRLETVSSDDYLVRDGASIDDVGLVTPSKENAKQEAGWDEQGNIEERKAAFNERLQRELGQTEANREAGGRSQGVGQGGLGPAGRVPGTGSLDQADLNQGEARGSIFFKNFAPGEMGSALIRLGESSDLTTFLHEFGHLAHLTLESLATAQDAPKEFRSMWNNTLQWWGVSQEQWSQLTQAEREPYFEQWARTFEAYLMEGKAPSLSLKEAFEAFKGWLKEIYRRVLRLDHNLNPEIRDVFDRLLATDAQIAEARAEMGADRSLTRESFAGTEEEWQAYQQAVQDAKDAAEAELRARVMATHFRRATRAWRAEREAIRNEATRAVDSDPARRAADWLGLHEWKSLPDTGGSEEGDISYVAPQNALEEKPADLPDMALDPQALAADYPDVPLPVSVNPRVDADTVLAEAMQLKRAGKSSRALRLAAFVRANGGIRDETGAIKDALGSGRNRPGLINNQTGKTPEELMRLAIAAGYFGAGAAREGGYSLSQDEFDAGARLPRRVVDVNTPRGETHETIVNPTEADILRLTAPRREAFTGSAVERGVAPSAWSQVRYIRDGDNVYVGNAYNVTHQDLVEAHGLQGKGRGNVEGGVIIRQPDGSLELQNDAGARPLPRGWLNGRTPASPDVGARLPRQVMDAGRLSGAEFEMVRNPSEADVARLMRQSGRNNQRPELRYVRDANGNVYIGEARSTTHQAMAGEAGFDIRGDGNTDGFIVDLGNGPVFLEKEDSRDQARPLRELLRPTSNAPDRGAAGNGRELPFDETQTLHRYGPLEVNPNGAHGPGIYFANSPETAQRGLWEGLGARGQYPARLSDSATLSSGHARGPFAPVSRYRALTDAGKTPAEAVAALRADGYRGIRDGRTGFTSVFDANDFRPSPGAPARGATNARPYRATVFHGAPKGVEGEWRPNTFFGATRAKADIYAYNSATDRPGEVRAAEIELRNPYRIVSDEPTEIGKALEIGDPQQVAAIADRLKAQGYDGIVVQTAEADTPRNIVEVLAFDPEQAIANARNSGELKQSGTSLPPPIFRSEIERTLERSTTNSASGAQWLATISKTPGVKKEEIDWIGLPDFLKAQTGQVSRQEALDFVRANGVQVEETVLGGDGLSAELQSKLLPLIEERDKLTDEYTSIQGEVKPGPDGRREFSDEQKARIEANRARADSVQQQIYVLENKQDRNTNRTKWSSYTLPGAEPGSYRELLLRLPASERVPSLYEVVERRGEWRIVRHDDDAISGSGGYQSREEAQAAADRENAKWPRDKINPSDFKSSHWDAANVLAHVRFNERTDTQGRRTLFVEEVQSDWGQSLRKNKEAFHTEINHDFDNIVARMKDEGVLKEVCD